VDERMAATTTARPVKKRTFWRTVTLTLPPHDYQRLTAIVRRDRTTYATIAREALQSYLADLADRGTQ
jgi:predicted DNA-binding protein